MTTAKRCIPKGNCKKAILARREIIKRDMQPLLYKKLPCNAKGIKKVVVVKKSISETAQHASKSKASTRAALRLPEALKKAHFVCSQKIHGHQQRSMKIKDVKICKSKLAGIGIVKLTIGKREKDYVHYCITAYKKKKGR